MPICSRCHVGFEADSPCPNCGRHAEAKDVRSAILYRVENVLQVAGDLVPLLGIWFVATLLHFGVTLAALGIADAVTGSAWMQPAAIVVTHALLAPVLLAEFLGILEWGLRWQWLWLLANSFVWVLVIHGMVVFLRRRI